jgi:DNA invertase Pin-like site-specific DNA recombinase
MSTSHFPRERYVFSLRRSTDKQDTSIEQQRDEVVKLATRNSYHVLREYVDDVISGDDIFRKVEFIRMIRDAKSRGDFDVILCSE